MSELLRIYSPEECGEDGYPVAWHFGNESWFEEGPTGELGNELMPAIKDLLRQLAGYRCERCNHPYPPGIAKDHPRGEWTPCDELCMHAAPSRYRPAGERGAWRPGEPGHIVAESLYEYGPDGQLVQRWEAEAQWRILTVHHLNGVKWDCRWWNLAALCQRCHLTIQGRVIMDRVYPFEHSEWFKPHAAGWYAYDYLGLDLTREETMERLDELLALERA